MLKVYDFAVVTIQILLASGTALSRPLSLNILTPFQKILDPP